jgi:2-desacetyl-2-hydroxyethyl bacteriochlorophyllide A dehydrogenase
MKRICLYFTAPRQVEVCEESLPPLAPGEVLVRTRLSAISPGSEMLVFRGQFPTGLPLDENLSALAGEFRYPLMYGYAAVGQVVEVGEAVDPAWEGRPVFAFQPHASHFAAQPENLFQIPDGISPEEAAFLPNMETAVNLVMDGAPLIGEKAVVFGQGVVGLLAAALLARFPLASLVALDRYPLRRQASLAYGVHASFDPAGPQALAQVRASMPDGADLAFELSGAPEALDQAIAVTGFAGRVVIGSWYGQKRASLDLGGRFHRSRIRLISSQVSTLAPELSGRWTKARRFGLAWEMIRKVQPAELITQRFPIQQAAQAYALLEQDPGKAIQILLTYA